MPQAGQGALALEGRISDGFVLAALQQISDPVAWACLAALAVLEEPLVGDQNFWTTRPHRWTALLGAKLIFVVLAIHLPSFVADLFVLAARGFPPAVYLGDLLVKQILFFGVIILPSIALASLVRNFTHFVITAFTIAAGLAILRVPSGVR